RRRISDIELKTQRKRGGLQSLELEGGVRLGNLGPNHTPALMPAELLHGVRRGNSDAVSRQPAGVNKRRIQRTEIGGQSSAKRRNVDGIIIRAENARIGRSGSHNCVNPYCAIKKRE